MTQKHTPGPWNWQGPISRNLANCLSGGGRPLLRCIDVSETDARLIAAAPELLEALKDLLETFEAEIHCEYNGTSMLYEKLSYADGARAAIAKATNQPKE